VAVVKRVVSAVEDPRRSVHSTLGEAQRAVAASSVDEVLTTAEELGHADIADLLSACRDTAAQLAELELKWLERAGDDLDALTERAVISTVLGDALLAAVRREAQKQASRTHFGTD
jgi:hypothetical protein